MRLRDWCEGTCFSVILTGFRLLGFMSIESIFFSSTLFSFCMSLYLDMSCLVLELVPLVRWLNCLGALVSSTLLMERSLV